MQDAVLHIKDLCIAFASKTVLHDVSLSLEWGKTLAIVGESGSGKSVTAMAVLGLLPKSTKVQGSILFEGVELQNASASLLRTIRGNNIAMIFQEPMTSLNPVFTVGEQIEETVRLHRNLSRKKAKEVSMSALEEVGISSKRFSSYPHEFSGGMRQRVMIAMALVCEPMLLIADEPTTALDATTSRQIMKLLHALKTQRAMSMLFISHDLKLVASIADDVCVMQHGRVVERGIAREVLHAPKHAYTQELVSCIPTLG